MFVKSFHKIKGPEVVLFVGIIWRREKAPMIPTQSYFLLTEGWRMFLPEGPLVDTTNRERLQLITRENGKSLSKSNQHVRKAHYGGFLLLNVNDVNVPKGNTAYN